MHQRASPGRWGREVRPDALETKVAALKGRFSISMKNGGIVKSLMVISGLRIVILMSGNPSVS